MKHIKLYNSYSLNELFLHRDETDSDYTDKYFVQYKSDLWIFSKKNYKNYKADIETKLKMEFSSKFRYFIEELSNKAPHIMVGEIAKPYLIIYCTSGYRHSRISPDLKKVMKQLNLSTIKTKYIEVSEREDEVYGFDKKDDGLDTNLINKTFYHGTSTSAIQNIIRKGLMPRKHTNAASNYSWLDHSDKLFLTLNIERAYVHAMGSAIGTETFPIIIELKVPDISKLDIDYDVATSFLGGDERIKKLGYDKIHKELDTITNNAGLPSINNKLGLYSYLGRIPKSYISGVRIDTDTYEEFSKAYAYEEEYDIQSEISSMSHDTFYWKTFKLDELNSYFEGVDDEIYDNE